MRTQGHYSTLQSIVSTQWANYKVSTKYSIYKVSIKYSICTMGYLQSIVSTNYSIYTTKYTNGRVSIVSTQTKANYSASNYASWALRLDAQGHNDAQITFTRRRSVATSREREIRPFLFTTIQKTRRLQGWEKPRHTPAQGGACIQATKRVRQRVYPIP